MLFSLQAADVQFCHFNAIGDCDMLLITLCGADTDSFCDKVCVHESVKHLFTVIYTYKGARNGP